MPKELASLVAAAQDGDRSAFDELVRATYAETYTLAFRLTGDEEDARDVVQDAYLRAYRSIKKFRGDAQFTTWLYRITANCANTLLVKRSKHDHDDIDDEFTFVDEVVQRNPEASSESSELRHRLVDALQTLPPRLRAVVVLRDVYDLPHEEIAEQLDISTSAAKVRLHRARKKLRSQLFPLAGEEDAHAV